MLSRPVLRGRQGKWLLALIEYCLTYVSQKAVKGQALADFLAEHPCSPVEVALYEVFSVEKKPWRVMFDGSKTEEGVGAGVVSVSPTTRKIGYDHIFFPGVF